MHLHTHRHTHLLVMTAGVFVLALEHELIPCSTAGKLISFCRSTLLLVDVRKSADSELFPRRITS